MSRSRLILRRLRALDAWTAAFWYFVITLAMTWPVVTGLRTRLPNDLGDPLFNCWVLAWNLGRLAQLLHGDLAAVSGYWNAGIFHPEPLALGYSDHLFAQAIQALPLYAVSGNVVLCYNTLFLSTFVLSGLGVFLLVRDLTGSARAAFVAGLCYAFAPYRVTQLGHLQVLSSQWMPFVFFGLRRFFAARANTLAGGSHAAGGAWPIAGASLALVAQCLSCGYYLVFFPPFVVGYAAWEAARRNLWRDRRTWLGLAAAAAGVAAACLPFLSKYGELRRLGFGPRPLDEVQQFSADALAYLRASDGLWLWPAGFTPFVRHEGHLFPGVVPLALALAGLACLAWRLRQRVLDRPPLRGWRLALAIPAAVVGVAALDLARFELFAGRHIWRVRDAAPMLADIRHVFLVIAAAAACLCALSPRVRAASRLALLSHRALFTGMFLCAAWMSFGPIVMTGAHGIAPDTTYLWLYRHVPGFDGLRVPARFGMLAMLFLAIVAGYGAAAIERGTAAVASRFGMGRRQGLAGRALLAAIGAFFLLESTAAPIDFPRIQWKRHDLPGVVSARDMAPLYEYIRRMPGGTVVAELPFGETEAETRAVFLSIVHGHPIVNGYSGGFPRPYEARKALLQDPLGKGGDPAWRALVAAGATCVVLHGWAYEGGGRSIADWLEARGARPLATFNADRIFLIPATRPVPARP